jgi:uncharacterized protein YggL (DUF469 family)
MVKTTVKLLIDPQKNSLTFSKNFRIFSTSDPVSGIIEFTDFVEDLIIAVSNTLDLTNLSRKFRYSRNRLDWSLWYEVEPGNLGDAAGILLDEHDEFYFEVKYEYDDGTSDEMSTLIEINEIKLRFRQAAQIANTYSPQVICSDEKCTSIIQNRDPSFRPYNVDSAIGMFQELSFFTNQLYGHQVVYFRTLPESDSGDFVFKEWTLYKNVDRKCIKVMVKDNAFPENTPKFTEFGIDFQLPFEVEIDHKYFQSIFGVSSEPRKRDFLYFPLINRMFEIQGSYLHRGFMMAPTFWKIQLKKYNPNIDMLLMDETRTFLDNVITSAEELFGGEVEKDIKDATMPAQYAKITTTFDSSRKALHPDITQRPLKYTFNFAPLIENYYDLGSIQPVDLTVDLTNDAPPLSTSQQVATLPSLDKLPPVQNNVILAYQGSDLYATWKNGGLLTNDKNVKGTGLRYCRVRGPFDTIPNHIGTSESGRYIRIEAYRDISLKDQRDVLIDTSAPVNTASFKLKDTAIVYSALPKFNHADAQNLSFTCLFNVPSESDTLAFIDGYDNENSKGIRVAATFSRYTSTLPEGDLVITVTVNLQVKTYTIPNFVSGIWHAMVISASNEFRQCGAYIYEIKEDPSDLINHNDFLRKLSSTSSFTPEEFDLTQNYTLPNSKLLITNLRVFNTMLREEEHDFILSQQFLKDESMLVLIDNCRPQTNLPYIAKNR